MPAKKPGSPIFQPLAPLSAVNGVDLSGEVEGKVKAIHFQSGQFVKQGSIAGN